MGRCKLCNTTSKGISTEIGVCLSCIRKRPEKALPLAMEAHRRSRAASGLPGSPPRDPEGLCCSICVNECRIPPGGLGYCGLRRNEGARLAGVSPDAAKVSWYNDPLPTNCVGDWVCPGGTGAGYPKHACISGPEYGHNNLAVFFHACSLNCLYCQNWHFRNETFSSRTKSPEQLLSGLDERTSCICYFGGDPTPQLPFAIRASRLALEKRAGRILRICWETNGTMHERLLDEMIELSLDSGGCIKFDLKAWDDTLHQALTGITNRRTIENFERAGKQISRRKDPPLLIANTLLVPGYIDEEEIRSITRFIASIDPHIPYSMLAFHPHFYMSDMPITSRALAERCLKVAKEEGLRNVRLGNVHLLV